MKYAQLLIGAAAWLVLCGGGAAINFAYGGDLIHRFDFGSGPVSSGAARVSPDDVYTPQRGYGFLPGYQPKASGAACVGDPVFYFTMDVPEGNYTVRLTLGGDDDAVAVVKAESRRLMLAPVETRARETAERAFTVNVRNSHIGPDEDVRLKSREIGAFHWDDRLTLEFNGTRPALRSMEVEKNDDAVTVFLAGDSTVTDQTQEPWCAWGQMLPRFFDENAAIANHAESGETLRAFVGERRLKKLLSLIRSGDYLFIQFAHNDMKRGTPEQIGYRDSLVQFIHEARVRGATPVLVTPMHRRAFDENGLIRNTFGDYPEVMRQTARGEGVALIDLNAMSRVLFEALGPEGTLKAFVHYPAGTFPGQDEALKDNTHFNSYGAYELARCVVEGIRERVPQLAKHLRGGVERFDPARPDPPESWTLPPSPMSSIARPPGG
ncbi:MAG: rhamnogalacturonan acetylesterase [bacterium]|nr:rhamnogalacturonan acetylesterase [bacterium]